MHIEAVVFFFAVVDRLDSQTPIYNWGLLKRENWRAGDGI